MAKGTCSIEGCERAVYARGWCEKHYARWRTHGDPTVTKVPNYGTGRTLKAGYVLVWKPEHPLANSIGYVPEHRLVAYEEGLLVDPADHVHHRDGNKQNNAVGNLEVMSKSDHHREHAAEGIAGMQSRKTHCPHGHPYDDANTRVRGGRRHCRICDRASWRAWYQRKKEKR